MEIEVPVEAPRTFSNIVRHGRHILVLETILMTVYYPADAPYSDQKASRELWIGRPRLSAAHGYGKFASLGWGLVPFMMPTLFTKLPAWRNAPLSNQIPRRREETEQFKERKPKQERLEPDEQNSKSKPKFPLIMFSHGLGGQRTMYSSICGEVGHVVLRSKAEED